MRIDRRGFFLWLATTAAATPQSTSAETTATNVAEAFGFVPDGTTDNYAAFHRFAAHVNHVGGGNYMFPPGTYFVHTFRIPKVSGHPYGGTKNSIIDRVSGLRIRGHGARIRLNGAFHRSARSIQGGGPVGHETGPFMPFEIHRSRDVEIHGFEIDGGVLSTTRDRDLGESYASLIAIHGCSNVLLEDLDLHHCQTDGIFISSSFLGGKPSIASRNIRLNRVKCRDNARGGLAVIQVVGLECANCAFSGNGRQLGRYQPHAPRFGVDIEPDYADPTWVDALTGDISFRNCDFADNGSALLAGYTDRFKGYLRVIDCRSSNRQNGSYHMVLCWPGAVIEGGRHDAGDGTIWLSWQGQRGGEILIRNTEILTSALYGIIHGYNGNLVQLDQVHISGTHKIAGTHGQVLAIQADPGAGRRNLVRRCEIFIPSSRKSRDHNYDYEVSFRYTLSQSNLFRTNLTAVDQEHFCTEYGVLAVARSDSFRGTLPGPSDSFRPVHNSTHDTRERYFHTVPSLSASLGLTI